MPRGWYTSRTIWDEERTALLRKGWAEGLSASQIARQLGGFAHTKDGGRNAVIGKVHRLGLTKRGASSSQPVKNPLGPRKTRARIAPAHVTKPIKETPLRAELALIAHLEPLHDAPVLRKSCAGQCRFIVGPPDTQICARAAVDGPWCVQHRRLVYRPANPKGRTRTAEGDELRRQLRREDWQ